jgi:hypothetical protein
MQVQIGKKLTLWVDHFSGMRSTEDRGKLVRRRLGGPFFYEAQGPVVAADRAWTVGQSGLTVIFG